MPNFTTEDLLVYLYHEMNPEQSADVEQALQNDWALQQKYQVIKEAQQLLTGTKLLSPRKKTVNKILKYAACNLHFSN